MNVLDNSRTLRLVIGNPTTALGRFLLLTELSAKVQLELGKDSPAKRIEAVGISVVGVTIDLVTNDNLMVTDYAWLYQLAQTIGAPHGMHHITEVRAPVEQKPNRFDLNLCPSCGADLRDSARDIHQETFTGLGPCHGPDGHPMACAQVNPRSQVVRITCRCEAVSTRRSSWWPKPPIEKPKDSE